MASRPRGRRRARLPYTLVGALGVFAYAALVTAAGGSSGSVDTSRRLSASNLTAGATNSSGAASEASLVAAIVQNPECTTPFDFNGGVAVYAFVTLYTFVGLAIVCDEYFCPSLEVISDVLHLSEDVAGATFMAAGSSAPELFTALVTIFIAPGEQGVGTIVGSAVFNLCVIVGLSCLFAGAILDIFWWPITRDSIMYGVSIVLMLIFMSDGLIAWWEALILTLLYFVYLGIMVINPRIVAWIEARSGSKSLPWPDVKVEVEATSSTSGAGAPAKATGDASTEEVKVAVDAAPTPAGTPADTPAVDAPAAEEEEEPPPGICGKMYAVFSKPMEIALYITIPDCRKDYWAKWYFVTFTMSVLWIGWLSFIMVDFASRMACVIGMTELLIGLVVLSVGTSVPDALASIIVAKEGKGSMAVCNALGSNIFNILLGLGLPWLVRVLIDGEPYPVPDFAAVGEPLILLLIYLVLFLGIIIAGGWKLSPKVGYVLLLCQAVYTTWTLLRNLPNVTSPVIDFSPN